MKYKIITNKANGSVNLFIDSKDFGSFESIDKDVYCFYPKRQDLITGDHYILIGNELNKMNNCNQDKNKKQFDEILEEIHWIKNELEEKTIEIESLDNRIYQLDKDNG